MTQATARRSNRSRLSRNHSGKILVTDDGLLEDSAISQLYNDLTGKSTSLSNVQNISQSMRNRSNNHQNLAHEDPDDSLSRSGPDVNVVFENMKYSQLFDPNFEAKCFNDFESRLLDLALDNRRSCSGRKIKNIKRSPKYIPFLRNKFDVVRWIIPVIF